MLSRPNSLVKTPAGTELAHRRLSHGASTQTAYTRTPQYAIGSNRGKPSKPGRKLLTVADPRLMLDFERSAK